MATERIDAMVPRSFFSSRARVLRMLTVPLELTFTAVQDAYPRWLQPRTLTTYARSIGPASSLSTAAYHLRGTLNVLRD